MYLNMINFDPVDFSERRFEEVISFFWRSVYYKSLYCEYIHCAQLCLFLSIDEEINLNWIFQITAFVIVGATQITEDQYISAG